MLSWLPYGHWWIGNWESGAVSRILSTGIFPKPLRHPEKNMYRIKFKFNKYIDFSNNKDVCKYVLRSPFIGLNSGISAYNDFEFGTIGIKIDTLEVYTEPL